MAAGSQEGNWVRPNLGKAWVRELWAFPELTSFFLFGQQERLGSHALCSHDPYLLVSFLTSQPSPTCWFSCKLGGF